MVLYSTVHKFLYLCSSPNKQLIKIDLVENKFTSVPIVQYGTEQYCVLVFILKTCPGQCGRPDYCCKARKSGSVQYCIEPYSIVHYSIVQYSIVQYIIVQYITVQFTTVIVYTLKTCPGQCRRPNYCCKAKKSGTAQYSTVYYGIVYSTVHRSADLYTKDLPR